MSARQIAPRRDVGLGRTDIGGEGYLLDDLLAARPELRETRRLVDEDWSAIADDVESALRLHDIDELNDRAGYHSGRGYVDRARPPTRSSTKRCNRSSTTLPGAGS